MTILVLSLLFFAGTIIAQKYVLLAGVPINAFLALRMLLPGAFFSFIEILGGRGRNLGKILNPKLIFLSTLTTFLPLFLKNLAHSKMSSGKFALIGSIDPFITCILSFFLFRTLISWPKLLGIILAVFGVIILTFHKNSIEFSQKIFFSFSWPELFVILAVGLSRFGWMTCQNFLKDGFLSENQANIAFMAIPGVFAASLSLLGGQVLSILNDFQVKTWIVMILSISMNAVGCFLMTKSLKKFSAVTISLAGTSIIPLFVTLASALIYGEKMSFALIYSMFFIFSGLIVFNFKQKVSA